MLGSLLVVAGAVGATGVALWLRRDRHYESSESVASAYDAWTEDRLLEQLWGEHVHLGHYGTPPGSCDFREAKEAFVTSWCDGAVWTNSLPAAGCWMWDAASVAVPESWRGITD